METHHWHPRVERPDDLIVPVRIDPSGHAGPTRHRAAGPRWRQTSAGLHVPVGAPQHVDQHILEQGSRIRSYGAVTAWAALRWRGGRFFDGTSSLSADHLPVPLVTGGRDLRPDPRVQISKSQLAPEERERVGGIWTAVASRALFDELRRHGDLRQAIVDVEMAIAAQLTDLVEFRSYVSGRNAWTGVGLARDAAAVAGLGCRSPQEARMALVWMWDAGLPRPLCNVPIFDLDGRLIALVDLLDPVAGCVGEYQGADHKDGDKHRDDVAREQRLRDHGLECFEVVGGDLQDRELSVKRMINARERSLFESVERRRWTLRQPTWWPAWSAARGL